MKKIIVANYLLIIFTIPLVAAPNYRAEHLEEWPSWTIYLTHLSCHQSYKNYQIPKNITQNGCKWGNWVTFSQKIEAIACRTGKWEHPMELFRSKDFLAMYKHPTYYRQALLNYLVDKRYPLEQKEIALYACSLDVLWQDAYQLYKAQKIDLTVLDLVFKINLCAAISRNHVGVTYKNRKLVKIFQTATYALLEKITQELPPTAPLCKNLKISLANNFSNLPEAWCKYYNFYVCFHDAHYSHYTKRLPFFDIIAHAAREKVAWRITKFGSAFYGMETTPYFLMVMEHPCYYYYDKLGVPLAVQNVLNLNELDPGYLLLNPAYSQEEKSMAILGMSQLGLAEHESEKYAFFMEQVCQWYQEGALSLSHLADLFVCSFPTHYKYPFFILDYKNQAVQRALDRFMTTPIIPSGLKAMARKLKNGTLATTEEMTYMEGYRQFRKTHFTLYETVSPPN